MTGVVNEFPELQGVMGRTYALKDGESVDVAWALDDQYAPMPPHQRRHQPANHLQLARPTPNRRSHEPLAADVKSAG